MNNITELTKLTDIKTDNHISHNEIEHNNNIFKLLCKVSTMNKEEIKQLCTTIYTSDDIEYRIRVLNLLYKYHKDECIEQFHKIKLQYYYNPQVKLNIDTLVAIVKYSELPTENKYECIKYIYNSFNHTSYNYENNTNNIYEVNTENEEKDDNEDEVNEENDDEVNDENKSNEELNNKNRNKEDNIAYDLYFYLIEFTENFDIHSLIYLNILKRLMETYKYKDIVKHILTKYIHKRFYNYLYDDILLIAENSNILQEYKTHIFRTYINMEIFSKNNKDQLNSQLSACQFVLNNRTLFNKEEIFTMDFKNEVEIFVIDKCKKSSFQHVAADILITSGLSEESRNIGYETIMKLGTNNMKNVSIYNNNQNVHDINIDNSVKQNIGHIMNYKLPKNAIILSFESTCKSIIIEFCKLNNIVIDNDILSLKNMYTKDINTDNEYDENTINENDDNDIDEDYQTESNDNSMVKLSKIKQSLIWVMLDRSIYFNNILLMNLLMKAWLIITTHEHKDTLLRIFLSELIELSGTCSSGYFTRITNVFSGFYVGDTLIETKISIASEMKALVLKELYNKINKITTNLPEDISKEELEKLEKYQNDVLDELTWENTYQAKNLNKFVINNVMDIRTLLYNEYVIQQKLVDDETFDVHFRFAINSIV